MRRLPSLLLPAVALLALTACVAPRSAPVAAARPASVEILIDGRLELSGWFADAEGHVITAAHGIAGHTNRVITIVRPGGERFPAERVALDTAHDLALLRTRDLPGAVPFLDVAQATPAAGARVWFFGSAEFRHGLLIEGNVARPEPVFNYYPNHRWITRCFLVAAPTPPGTSGGPWLDDRGRVVGNQSGYINTGASSAGIALLAQPAAIRRLVAERSAPPAVSLGCGVEELWTQNAGFIKRLPKDLAGLVTIPIVTNGPVDRAGLNKESVISEADGRPLRYASDLLPVLDAHQPGDEIDLRVWTPEQSSSRLVRVKLDAARP